MEFGGTGCPSCGSNDCVRLDRPVAIWNEDELPTFEEEGMVRRDHIETEISFLPTEHGGRKRAVASGYPPQFYYRNQGLCALHVDSERKLVEPGETVAAMLTFLDPSSHVGRVAAGMDFLIRKGNQVVAYGRVTRSLNLHESAQRAAESAI